MYKIGFIGLGKISTRHVAGIKNSDGFLQFTGGYDINIKTSEMFVKKNGGEIFSSPDEVIAKNDIIAVLTSHDTHAVMIKKIIAANKICICEKPICLHKDELSSIDNNIGRNIFCISQNRYNKAVCLAKEKMQSLGKIRFIQANTFWYRNAEYYTLSSWRGEAEKEGGILYNQGYHLLDAILYLLDATSKDCRIVFAQKENFEKSIKDTESYIKIILCVKGVMVDILVTTIFAKENFENSIVVAGENESIKISGNHLNEIEFPRECAFEYADKNIYGSSHIKNYNDILAALSGEENQIVNINEALDRINLLEKIYLFANERE